MRRTITISLILFLLTLPMIAVISDDVSGGLPIFSANTMVNWNDRFHDQIPMDISVDTGDRIYVVYHSKTSYVFNDVMITHSDDNGMTWAPGMRVDDNLLDGNESNDDTNQQFPSMVISQNSTVYVAWEDQRFDPAQIRMAWAEDGENFTRSIRIDLPKIHEDPEKEMKNWDSHKPNLVINDDDRLFCAWEDRNMEGAYRNVWSSYSTDGASSWSIPQMINSDRLLYDEHRNHDFIRAAIQGNDIYVTWQDGRDNTYGMKPYLTASNDGGETFSEEVEFTDDIQYNSRTRATPSLDDEGNLFIAWTDKRAGPDEIWFTRSEDKGQTFSQNVRVAMAPDETVDINPYVSALGDGLVSVVWQRDVPGLDDGEIYFRNSSDGGRNWDRIMRVDDTERYGSDPTTQSDPIMTYDNDGRPLVVWADERDFNTYRKDIFFAKHSGVNSAVNRAPEILIPLFWGDFEFNPAIGSNTSNYNFTFIYRDEDNDMPVSGYPNIQFYKDLLGTQPILSEPLVMWREFPGDIDFMDGQNYRLITNLNTMGKTYWRIEVKGERDSGAVVSDIMDGPVIDAKAPAVTVIYPTGTEWNSSDTVICRARITDVEGGGVNTSSIKYLKTTTGLDQIVNKPVPVQGVQKIDNSTYEVWAKVKLENGRDNYVIFQAMDRVGNGPGISEPVNLWIDSDPPFFTNHQPRVTQLYEDVNCSITWMDFKPGSDSSDASGVVPKTIRYSYRTTTDDFGEWLEPDGYVEVEPGAYNAWANIEFYDKGAYNKIRWKATDALGTENISSTYGVIVDIPVNYPPVFTGMAHPDRIFSSRPHLYWDEAFDEEDDTLFYKVQILNNNLWWFTTWVPVGENIFFDFPQDKKALDPGHYVLLINVTDGIGGWDIYEHTFRIVEEGTPPPVEVPTLGPYYLNSANQTISWEESPSRSSMEVGYLLRVGTYYLGGDVSSWIDYEDERTFTPYDLGLELGIYSLQIMTYSNGSYSRVSEGMIKISDYTPELHASTEHLAYRGKGAIKGEPFTFNIMNNGTYGDNVTIVIEGEIVSEGWATLTKSGETTAYYTLPSMKGLQDKQMTAVSIVFRPDDNAKKGEYTLRIKVIAEDGMTVVTSQEIIIEVGDAPTDGGSDDFTDDLYEMLTDVMPFLSWVPKDKLIPVFLFLVALFIVGIIVLGVSIQRRKMRKKANDPYLEQRRIYIELYGVEPTEEQLEAAVSGSEEDILGAIESLDEVDNTSNESFYVNEGADEGGDEPSPPSEDENDVEPMEQDDDPEPVVVEGDTLLSD
ncbi:MAG: exo-alpha-sialidase [Thermoplasmata archaeon]|nr:exo-alpha-sialidase [Thermoplasmata archaeon]